MRGINYSILFVLFVFGLAMLGMGCNGEDDSRPEDTGNDTDDTDELWVRILKELIKLSLSQTTLRACIHRSELPPL